MQVVGICILAVLIRLFTTSSSYSFSLSSSYFFLAVFLAEFGDGRYIDGHVVFARVLFLRVKGFSQVDTKWEQKSLFCIIINTIIIKRILINFPSTPHHILNKMIEYWIEL